MKNPDLTGSNRRALVLILCICAGVYMMSVMRKEEEQ